MSKKQANCTLKRTSIGGQALIEGVMMRGVSEYAVAVRQKDGTIHVETHPNKPVRWYNKMPVVRGMVNMFQSLILGYRCLSLSIDLSGFVDEDEPETVQAPAAQTTGQQTDPGPAEAPQQAASAPQSFPEQAAPETDTPAFAGQPSGGPAPVQAQPEESGDEKDGNGLLMGIAGVLGACLSLFLFLFLPTFLVDLLGEIRPLGWTRILFETIVKVGIFLLFLWLTGKQSDIKRLYRYHGAEHKSIACYEAGAELTPENAMRFRRFHPRCGTSFLFLAIIISIVVNAFVRVDGLWLRTGIKLLLLPLVVGLTYEVIKFAGRHDNPVTRVLSAPGLALQRLTTQEPDEEILEVAIASLKAVLPKDGEDDTW